jgi:hypothetical protein
MGRRLTMHRTLGLLQLVSAFAAAQSPSTLYNGIELPATWPPHDYALTAAPLRDPPGLVAAEVLLPLVGPTRRSSEKK